MERQRREQIEQRKKNEFEMSMLRKRAFHIMIKKTSIYCVLIMEKAMAPHSSTLAWKIPWTEGPGGLQSMGSLRVGHD